MIAGCKYVRWINTQEGAASFIREVKTGPPSENGKGAQKGHGWLTGELSRQWVGQGQLWVAGNRNTIERSPWGDSLKEPSAFILLCLEACRGCWPWPAEIHTEEERKLVFLPPLRYQWLNVTTVLRPSALRSAFSHPSLCLVEPEILASSPFLSPGQALTSACWWIWLKTQPALWFTASSVGSSPIGIWIVRHLGRQDSFETAVNSVQASISASFRYSLKFSPGLGRAVYAIVWPNGPYRGRSSIANLLSTVRPVE